MNFFGHAVVATWCRAGPTRDAFVLGAMLPDLVGMARVRLAPTLAAPDLAAGVELHHRTDAVFHDLAPVLELMRALGADLHARGCGRGPRRAAAHLGVELLLDGALATSNGAPHAAYLEALAVPIEAGWCGGVVDEARLGAVMARLRAAGAPVDLADPALAARRCVRALAHRPLLAANAADATHIAAAFAQAAPAVRARAAEVVAALRHALALPAAQAP